jgi:hypothetical protein
VYSSVVGYDGGWNVRDEERSVVQKKPEREQKEETKQSRWGFRGMTVRAWLELLIVPMVLVGIGLLFEMQQAERQPATEQQQQALADQRAQDEALQAYLNQISQLMLERKLLEAEPGDPVYTLAQARTSTVILRLDAEHSASVIRFLRDSGLAWSASARRGNDIGPAAVDTRPPPASVSLLSGIALNRADLSGADLSWADLSDADLSWADLSRAGLRGAYNEVNNEGTKRQLITNEELEQQVRSLEGATMPNGQKYEDWLKSKNREEGGKNDGSS